MTATIPSINHDDWNLFNSQGYREDFFSGEVRSYPAEGDVVETVRIGPALHRRDELVISEDGRRIESIHGWYLTR